MARYAQFVYNGAWNDANQSANYLSPLDSRFEWVAVTSAGVNELVNSSGESTADVTSIGKKALLYENIYGNQNYNKFQAYDYETAMMLGYNWDLGPYHFGFPDVKLQSTISCNQMTDAFVSEFYCYLEDIVLNHALQPKGIFMDDHLHDRRYWLGPAGEARDHANTVAAKRAVWGPMNGREGVTVYPDPDEWNEPRITAFNGLADGFVQNNSGKLFVFNSAGSTSWPTLTSRQPRVVEDALGGSYQTYSWIENQVSLGALKAGDVLLAYLRDYNSGSPQWRTVHTGDDMVTYGHLKDGQTTEQLYDQLVTLSNAHGLVICIGWHRDGNHSGSDIACLETPDDWAA